MLLGISAWETACSEAKPHSPTIQVLKILLPIKYLFSQPEAETTAL